MTQRIWNKWNILRMAALLGVALIAYTSIVKMMRGPVRGDFGVFYHAANLLRAGQDLYGIPTHPTPDGGLFYLYPPLFAVMAVPLTLVGLDLAVVLWTILNVLLIGIIVVCSWEIFFDAGFFKLPIRSRWIISVVSILLCSRFLLHHLDKGQTNLFVLALTIGGIWLAERTGAKAFGGALAGFAAVIKLVTFPLALWYLLTQRIRSFAGFAFGGVAGFLAPALFLGPARTFQLTSQWLFGYVLDGTQGSAHLDVTFNYSIRAQLFRFFGDVVGFVDQGRAYSLTIVRLPDSWILGLQVLLTFFTLGAIVFYHYRFKETSKIVQAGTLALFLLAIPLLFPTSQKHYFVFLLPAAVYTVSLWHRNRLSDGWFVTLLATSFALTGVSNPAIIGNAYSDFLAASGCFIYATVLLMAAIFRAAFILTGSDQNAMGRRPHKIRRH